MISIDIGASKIYVAETKGKGKRVKIQNLRVIPITSNVLIFDGKIRKDILKEYLGQILQNTKEKEVAITFSTLPIVSNEFILPYLMNQSKMSTMIKAKVFQTLSEEEYLFDYKVISTFTEEKNKQCNVVTYLTPRSIVSDTYDLILELGKKPAKFTNTQDSIFNFITNFLEDRVSIFVNITPMQMTFHLINRPDNIITRIALLGQPTELFGGEESDITQENHFSMLNDQIQKLIQYQTIKYIGENIEKIYLSGEGADEIMKNRLFSELNIPTMLLSELTQNFIQNTGQNWSPFIYAISAAV